MENEITTQSKNSLQNFFNQPVVREKLNDIFRDKNKVAAFISSVISVVNGNYMLKGADARTVVGAAIVAATLDLSVVPTLGEAYIVPYKTNGNIMAQFQIGYKGLYQLCIRSGQIKFVAAEPVHEGELIKANQFTGEYEFDPAKRQSDKVIGYMACIRMINGFEKTIYWTMDEVKKHASRFSQAYRQGKNTPWITDFDAMASKTVLKELLNKYAPKSMSMADGLRFDQSCVSVNAGAGNEIKEEDLNIDTLEPVYVDNDRDDTMNSIAEASGKAAEKNEDEKKMKK